MRIRVCVSFKYTKKLQVMLMCRINLSVRKPCNYLLVLTAHIYSVDFTSIISAKVSFMSRIHAKDPYFCPWTALLFFQIYCFAKPAIQLGLQFTLSRLTRGYFRYILIFLTLCNFLKPFQLRFNILLFDIKEAITHC